MQEGCLSVPGFYEDVERIEHCMIRAMDRDGKPFELGKRKACWLSVSSMRWIT